MNGKYVEVYLNRMGWGQASKGLSVRKRKRNKDKLQTNLDHIPQYMHPCARYDNILYIV